MSLMDTRIDWETSWPNITFPTFPTSWPQAIGHAVGEAVGKVYDQISKDMTSIFTDSSTSNNDKSVIAMGGATDILNEAIKNKQNSEIKGRTQPTPRACHSGVQAQKQAAIKEQANRVTKATQYASRTQIFHANSSGSNFTNARLKKFTAYQASFNGSSTGNSRDSLKSIYDAATVMVANFSNQHEIYNDASYINAMMSIETLIGFSAINGAGPLEEYLKSPSREDATKTSNSMRVIMSALSAQMVFTDMIGSKMPTVDDKTSLSTSLYEEVESTYGASSEKYWASINELQNPVPLMIELNKFKAFYNNLQLLKLEALERELALKAVIAIDTTRAFIKSKEFKAGITNGE